MSLTLNRFSKLLALTVFAMAMVMALITAAKASPAASSTPVSDNTDTAAVPQHSHRLIVQLKSPALAEVAQVRGLTLANGRVNFSAAATQAYLAQLQAEQAAFVQNMQTVLPSAAVATYINETGAEIQATYQVVLNAVAIDPGTTDLESARRALMGMDGVQNVFLDIAHQPTMYASLPLINAPAAWANLGGQENAGMGVKVASMDGGLHHDAAMFDGTGWSYPTGWPAGGLGDTANNNGKIIASRVYFRPWDPPSVGDENSWPGTNGTSHGVHTGSTIAGNEVVAEFSGITETVVGVAPAAWVMSYRVFYNSVTNNGSFYNVEGIAALEDIVMDGADVVNNSWGGGPGSMGGEFDALDTALINAHNAGVFVSMSNGNAGPGLGTGDHPSDEYINVAASTTSGTFATGKLYVTAPEPISDTLQGMPYGVGLFGPALEPGESYTYTFMTAASVDAGNVQGCNQWTGQPFAGQAVLISRGTCEFSLKVYYAQLAGAELVVIYNSVAGGNAVQDMGAGAFAGSVTIPSIFIGRTNGLNASAWYDEFGGDSEFLVEHVAYQVGNTPDVIAAFSSRGPGVGNVLKPDIAAPGVNILAQGYGSAAGEAAHLGYGQVSGTSMASPHVAGAATLLRQMYPEWSNAAIKSALMSTSKYMYIYNHNGTPAQPLDMGAGRLDIEAAMDPGVILGPPSLSFGQMVTGTDMTITITVTSVATETETYALSTLYTGGGFTPTTSLDGVTVSPMTITLAPGASAVVEVTFDSVDGYLGDNQGFVILDGDNGHHAHLPAWARVAPAPTAEVLVIDTDFSVLLGYPDYIQYYTDVLDNLGYTYDVWDADANFNNPTTIPDAATLSSYQVVIVFSGDHYQPNGSFTVATPLTALDMNRLVEYVNDGGILFVTGQDFSSVVAGDTNNAPFLYNSVLGGEHLRDGVANGNLPGLPLVSATDAPPALQGLSLDLTGSSWMMSGLYGANEVPPVASTASAEGYYALNMATNELSYNITVQVSDPLTITASHIHSGTAGVNGGVLFTLFTGPQLVTDTFNFEGDVTLTTEQVSQVMAGGMYVNIHTTANPSGELRGQVIAAVNGDGAGNQAWIDEISSNPNSDPNPVPGFASTYVPLLKYPGANNIDDGTVAMAHRDQPTLEYPGVAFPGRAIYTTFGLEGVNNGLGTTTREELVDTLLTWAMNEPTAVITDITGTYSDTTHSTILQAYTANAVSYRWDFGDGTAYTTAAASDTVGHTYAQCGTYTVRVEATNNWGNKAIGTQTVTVTQCAPTTMWHTYLPLLNRE